MLQPGAEAENNKESAEKKPKVVRVNEPTQLLQQDWREFTCTTWHVEPTVRYFMSCPLPSCTLPYVLPALPIYISVQILHPFLLPKWYYLSQTR